VSHIGGASAMPPATHAHVPGTEDPAAPPRARMSREERHAQLIELGTQLVKVSSFDEVSIEQVADAAGISRGLLFHYFPTRRDFLLAIARAGADDLLARTAPNPDLPPLEQLQAGLDAFIDYVLEHRDAYVAVIRGAASGDPAMLDVVADTRATFVDRILDGFGLDAHTCAPVLPVAIHGWLGFMEESTLAWLDRDLDRASLTGLCQSMLLAALVSAGVDLTAVLEDAGA
jgi:AcrR family transcriptional regulator